MPFSHFHYRWVKSQNYAYEKRRCCYLAVCLIYSLICAVIGTVFLILYIQKINYLDTLNCSVCNRFGTTTQCYYHTCCNVNTGLEYSYAYCAGVYGQGIYFILFIVFYSYAAYELFLMVCTLCNGSALQNNNDIIVIDQNPQYIGLNNYPGQQIYVNQRTY